MAICEAKCLTTIATAEITGGEIMTARRVTIIQWLYDCVLVKETKLFGEQFLIKPEDYKLSQSMWRANGKPKHAIVTEDNRILFHYAT